MDGYSDIQSFDTYTPPVFTQASTGLSLPNIFTYAEADYTRWWSWCAWFPLCMCVWGGVRVGAAPLCLPLVDASYALLALLFSMAMRLCLYIFVCAFAWGAGPRLAQQ